jgi:hypothetical protein
LPLKGRRLVAVHPSPARAFAFDCGRTPSGPASALPPLPPPGDLRSSPSSCWGTVGAGCGGVPLVPIRAALARSDENGNAFRQLSAPAWAKCVRFLLLVGPRLTRRGLLRAPRPTRWHHPGRRLGSNWTFRALCQVGRFQPATALGLPTPGTKHFTTPPAAYLRSGRPASGAGRSASWQRSHGGQAGLLRQRRRSAGSARRSLNAEARYGRLRRALDSGNPTIALAAATELDCE